VFELLEQQGRAGLAFERLDAATGISCYGAQELLQLVGCAGIELGIGTVGDPRNFTEGLLASR
jgi:hypothetical protein